MAVGKGTNTKVELLARRGLLWSAQKKNFLALSVMGDSKVIVDWDNIVHSIQFVDLYHWLRRVK